MTPIKDKESILLIREILDETYIDGITAITSAQIDDNGDIMGTFQDKIGGLTKEFEFKITDEEIEYGLLNPEEVKNYKGGQ